jgi:thiamine kinase-like enzyme
MMNYQKIITNLSIFHSKSIVIEPLIGGVTNANFKISDGQNKFVARFGFESNKYLRLNRSGEIYNHTVVSKLGLSGKIVKFYAEYNMLLVEYLEGKTLDAKIARKPKIIDQLAKILRKIHEGPKFKGIFDPFKVSRDYFDIVKNSWIPKPAKQLLKELEKYKVQLRGMNLSYSCHLDLFPPNILLKDDKIKLLDWEYSARSDYRFDLATLSAMAEFEPKHDKLLIKSYGKNDLSLDQLNIAKAIMLIREIGWDLVQVKYSKLYFDYKKYTFDNLKRYQKVLKYQTIV